MKTKTNKTNTNISKELQHSLLLNVILTIGFIIIYIINYL